MLAQHDHPAPSGAAAGWHFMQDGAVFVTFNHQGGPLGETELVSQNWWMGMLGRQAGPGRLTLSTMLSLEPIRERGYSELFQIGESWQGRPIVDRQHPHDFLVQLAAVWKLPLGERSSLTIAGAPVGEPALGPVAYMHRRSDAENPTAPIGHHTFDATHIAMGVITGGFERGRWFVEASAFHGREPHGNRWDLADLGPPDSWSARLWFRPTGRWTFQISQGRLNEPELLVGTHTLGRYTGYGRFEATDVETDVLRFGVHPIAHSHLGGVVPPTPIDTGLALTAGATRDLGRWAGFEFAAGGDATFYGVPDALVPTHSSRPGSFHVYLRTRLPAPSGRMWNAVMARPGH